MRKFITFFILISALFPKCFGQYDKNGLVISGGINYSKYIGHGKGDNYFENETPGYQLEITVNNGRGFEWVLWGVDYRKAANRVINNSVPVTFWTPYYTEFLFYQKAKKHPLFWFFGYDYVRMKFPEMEKPDGHYNITFGTGWNLKLSDRLFLQFKIKPYIIIGNSIGQWFGANSMVNLHFNKTN